jgi:hypothetical protein
VLGRISKEIDEIVSIHVEHLKTATVVMHVAQLLEGDFTRTNLEDRRLKNSVPAYIRQQSCPKKSGRMFFLLGGKPFLTMNTACLRQVGRRMGE